MWRIFVVPTFLRANNGDEEEDGYSKRRIENGTVRFSCAVVKSEVTTIKNYSFYFLLVSCNMKNCFAWY